MFHVKPRHDGRHHHRWRPCRRQARPAARRPDPFRRGRRVGPPAICPEAADAGHCSHGRPAPQPETSSRPVARAVPRRNTRNSERRLCPRPPPTSGTWTGPATGSRPIRDERPVVDPAGCRAARPPAHPGLGCSRLRTRSEAGHRPPRRRRTGVPMTHRAHGPAGGRVPPGRGSGPVRSARASRDRGRDRLRTGHAVTERAADAAPARSHAGGRAVAVPALGGCTGRLDGRSAPAAGYRRVPARLQPGRT